MLIGCFPPKTMGVTTPLGQLQGCSQGGKHPPMQDRSAQFSMSAADLARRRTAYATMSPVSRTARAQATSSGDTDAFILARQEQLLCYRQPGCHCCLPSGQTPRARTNSINKSSPPGDLLLSNSPPSASWCALDLEPPKGFSSFIEEIDEFHWQCSRALRQ